ncbi:unnamed protein product [Caenorhabditis nigoni]
MAKIMTKSKITKASDILLFYYKRFRRILPLYFLVIFGTVIMVHFYLGEYLWENNNRYYSASLFLVTNQLVIHDQADYFNAFFTSTASINAFLHLWSLSVEMQFYLLVPFIFLGLQMLKHNYLKAQIIDTNRAQLPYSWSHEPKRFECTEEKIEEQIEDNRVFGYGSCIRGNGNFSIMMIGNSYVMSLRNPIRTQFSSNYSDFRYISLAAGYGLYSDTPTSHLSLEISRKNVERYKPDVLFILARHSPSIKQPIQEDDQRVQEMNINIKFYEKFVKKIVILDAVPLFPLGFVDIFLQNVVHRPEALESLNLDRRIADKEMKLAKKRFSMLKCTKCQFFDWSHVFLEGDKYLTFDRDTLISYVDNTIHLTAAGLKMCENVFKTVAQEVMDTI